MSGQQPSIKPNLLARTTAVDYGALANVLSNASVPSDIDGVVERNGHFLFMECKHPGDPAMSEGQRIMLEHLAEHKNTTVLAIRLSGERTDIGALRFNPTHVMQIGKDKEWQETDLSNFILRYQGWERRVIKKPSSVF